MSAQAEAVQQAQSGQEGAALLIKAHHLTPNQVRLSHTLSCVKQLPCCSCSITCRASACWQLLLQQEKKRKDHAGRRDSSEAHGEPKLPFVSSRPTL